MPTRRCTASSTISASRNRASNSRTALFFNGIENMSIRVSRQEPDTHLLHDVLIYDNRIAANGNMNTIVADSGYIRLSDDKRFLLVDAFQRRDVRAKTRNSQWFKSRLRHHIFDKQDQTIPHGRLRHAAQRRQPIFEQPDQEHQRAAAGYRLAEILVNNATTRSYEPLLTLGVGLPLGTQTPRQGADMEPGADAGQKLAQHVLVRRVGRKEALNQLYRSKVEWHKGKYRFRCRS